MDAPNTELRRNDAADFLRVEDDGSAPGPRPVERPTPPRWRWLRARRRRLIAAAAVAGTLALPAGIWGFLIEPDLLAVREVTIRSAHWPADLPALRIVAMADIHAGAPFIDEAKLDRIVAESNARHPDLVVLLGDYVIQGILFGTPMPPETIAAHLSGLRAKYGVVAILGNHDWYLSGARVTRAFEDVGIRVLENAAAPLPGLDGRVWVMGIGDWTTGHGDPRRAWRSLPQAADGADGADGPDGPDGKDGTPAPAVVTLMHDPAAFPHLPAPTALTLAGHTHGGQVALPWIGALYTPPVTPRRYTRGHVVEDGRDLYVSSGIGTTMLAVRFNVRPEIVEITLTAAGG